MGKPPLWFKKAIAWFGVALFLTDTGSDGYVGGNLINRCHIYYGSSVLSFFYIPGLLSGGYFLAVVFTDQYLQKKCGYDAGGCAILALFLLGTILGPIVFVPASFFILVKAAIAPQDEDLPMFAKLLKGYEMVFESYPQMVLSVFIMQTLQIKEWFNIGSCFISTFSVLYGFSELLAAFTHGPNYPFTKTIFGMGALLLDTLLRALSMAYLMTFFKVYMLLMPFIYFLVMVPIIFIKHKKYKCSGFWYCCLCAIISFGCSAFEGIEKNLNSTLRLISKAVYSIVLVTFALYFGFTVAPGLLSKDSDDMNTPYNSTLANKYNSTVCESLCPREGVNQTEVESYCNNLSTI